MLAANPARGEVRFSAGGRDVVLCFEMARVAALCKEVGSNGYMDIYARCCILLDLVAISAAIRHLAVRGDAEAVVNAMRPADIKLSADALKEVFNPEAIAAEAGNVEGEAAGENPPLAASPGATG